MTIAPYPIDRQLSLFISSLMQLDKLTIEEKGIFNVCLSNKGMSLFMDANEKSFVHKFIGKDGKEQYAIHNCERSCNDVQINGLVDIVTTISQHRRPYPIMVERLEKFGFEVLMNSAIGLKDGKGFIVGRKFRIIYN